MRQSLILLSRQPAKPPSQVIVSGSSTAVQQPDVEEVVVVPEVNESGIQALPRQELRDGL